MLRRLLLSFCATWPHPPESLARWDSLCVLMAISCSQTTEFWCLLTHMWWLSVSVELCFCIGYSKLLQISTNNLIQQLSDPSAIVQMKILETLTTWIQNMLFHFVYHFNSKRVLALTRSALKTNSSHYYLR